MASFDWPGGSGGTTDGSPSIVVPAFTSPGDSIEFAGLDGNAAGAYDAFFRIYNAAGSTADLAFRVNGSTMNVSTRRLYGTTVAGADAATVAVLNGNTTLIHLHLFARAQGSAERGALLDYATMGATILKGQIAIRYADATTNITGFGFLSAVAGGIGIGSGAWGFKRMVA